MNVAIRQALVDFSQRAEPSRRRGSRAGWIVLAVLSLAFIPWVYGVAPGQIFQYLAYLTLFSVVPGVVAYLWLSPRPRSPLTVLVHGACLGLALETLAYLGFATAHSTSWFRLYPIPILAFGLIRRNRLRAKLLGGPTNGWFCAGLLCTSWLVLVLVVQPVLAGGPEGHFAWVIAYARALAHGWPVPDPYRFDGLLTYHYLFYAHLAAAASVTGVSLDILATRLCLVAYFPLVMLLVVDLALETGARPVLALLVVLQAFGTVGFLDGTLAKWFSHGISTSLLLVPASLAGLLIFFVLLREIADWVSGGAWADRQLLMIGVLLFAGSGFRSSVLPVLGIAVAFLACSEASATRSLPWRTLLVLALLILAFVAGLRTFYGYHSRVDATQALTLNPLSAVSFLPLYPWLQEKGVPGSAALAFLVMLLGRHTFLLAGLPALVKVRHRLAMKPLHFLLFGTYIGGLAFLAMTEAPGGSEYTFFHYSHVAFDCLAAWGLSEFLRNPSRGKTFLLVVTLGLGMLILHAVDVGPGLVRGLAALCSRHPVTRAVSADFQEALNFLRQAASEHTLVAVMGESKSEYSEVEQCELWLGAELEHGRLVASTFVLRQYLHRGSVEETVRRQYQVLTALQSADPAVIQQGVDQLKSLLPPHAELLILEVRPKGVPLDRGFLGELEFENPSYRVWRPHPPAS
jgi:hypothetical protein